MQTLANIMRASAWTKRNHMHALVGTNLLGKVVTRDITSCPHLLIAGTTGSGKSMLMHSLICSLLYRNAPHKLKLLLIDPKRVELNIYKGLRHCDAFVTNVDDGLDIVEMTLAIIDERYALLERYNVRNVSELPYLLPKQLIVIDELADLVLSNKRFGVQLARVAALGRAAGVHIIACTQRPDAQVLPGILRSNIPARIALRVGKAADSRIILDQGGAEHLRNAGDMIVKLSYGDMFKARSIMISNNDLKEFIKIINLF